MRKDNLIIKGSGLVYCGWCYRESHNCICIHGEPVQDEIQKPIHYNQGEIECIDAIKASMTPEEFKGYLKGNVEKYIWRYSYKGKPKEDLQKAEFYLRRLIKDLN